MRLIIVLKPKKKMDTLRATVRIAFCSGGQQTDGQLLLCSIVVLLHCDCSDDLCYLDENGTVAQVALTK